MSQYIGAVEAARLLGISRQAVTLACRAGRLKAIRIGRDWLIERASVAGYQKGHKSCSAG